MSEQEFELYLKLLARCLSLTPGQREQIADELRDHLEERLDELARTGVSREQAVVQALDEFGDAAVLAAHFSTIARLKRRRFLMRLSLGSVGALAAAMVIALALWPDNRAVRVPERIVADDKPKTAAPPTAPPTAVNPTAVKPNAVKQPTTIKKSKSENKRKTDSHLSRRSGMPGVGKSAGAGLEGVARIEQNLSSDVGDSPQIEAALQSPLNATLEPQPLRDAIEFIANQYRIPIMLDQKALDESNVELTSEVRLNAPGIRMSDALSLIFDQASQPLDYEVRNGVLVVTTAEKVASDRVTVVYDCRDLMRTHSFDIAERGQSSEGGGTGTAGMVGGMGGGGGAMGGAMFQFGGGANVVTTPVPPRANGATQPASPAAAKSQPAAVPGRTAPSRQRLPLIEILIAGTDANHWDEDGSISELNGLLIIRQNPRVHRAIKSLLADIRRMAVEGEFAKLTSNGPVPQGAEKGESR